MDLVSGERDSRFARFLRFADESQFPSTSAKRDGDERSTLNLQSGGNPHYVLSIGKKSEKKVGTGWTNAGWWATLLAIKSGWKRTGFVCTGLFKWRDRSAIEFETPTRAPRSVLDFCRVLLFGSFLLVTNSSVRLALQLRWPQKSSRKHTPHHRREPRPDSRASF